MTAPMPPRPTKVFGLWLLDQQRRKDWIGDLARGAAADRMFPKLGMPYEVMAHVQMFMADCDMAHAVDAAANEWFGGNGWRLQGLIDAPAPDDDEQRAAA